LFGKAGSIWVGEKKETFKWSGAEELVRTVHPGDKGQAKITGETVETEIWVIDKKARTGDTTFGAGVGQKKSTGGKVWTEIPK